MFGDSLGQRLESPNLPSKTPKNRLEQASDVWGVHSEIWGGLWKCWFFCGGIFGCKKRPERFPPEMCPREHCSCKFARIFRFVQTFKTTRNKPTNKTTQTNQQQQGTTSQTNKNTNNKRTSKETAHHIYL